MTIDTMNMMCRLLKEEVSGGVIEVDCVGIEKRNWLIDWVIFQRLKVSVGRGIEQENK